MTVFVLPSGPRVHTSFCTATLLVGGRRPLGGWHIPNWCCQEEKEAGNVHYASAETFLNVTDDIWHQCDVTVYLWEEIRPNHASPPLAGHAIRWPQGQGSLTNVCRDRVDHFSLHWTCVSAREGLVEAHHRWAWSRHDLIISVVIGDRRLGGRQDRVGQVWTTRAGVRLLPAQFSSIIHGMLPAKQREDMLK